MAIRTLILLEGHRSIGLLYIKAAQHLGLHPITLASDPSQYGYLSTEGIHSVKVDTSNLDAIIDECSRLCDTHNIAGVTGFTGADESIYIMVSKLCRHFGLLGPDPASIERCCDKFVQRQFLAQADVSMPAYRLASDLIGAKSSAAEIGLPVIVKPTVGSGSCGVRLCRTVDELTEHAAYLLGRKHTSHSSARILVEEFVQGPQYSAYAMGNSIVGICAADFGSPPYFVYRHFSFPAPLSNHEHERIAHMSLSCLRALGLGCGPAHIEFRWTNRGPVVIEVNPRLPGGTAPRLIQLAHGVDLVTEHIRFVIGEEWDLRRRHSHNAAAHFLVPDRDGMLDSIDGDRAAAIQGVAEVKFYVEPKSPILRTGDYRDTIGHVIATSPSPAQTEAILQRAVDLIEWSITPYPPLGQ
ncbi:acetyl-CoA carboxylase biotin carboxylase subunit family protein [Mesorhizobium sp. M0898]|uniref:ATP-grasp domain-containing protein n=1 Tax=Mesorhizobium sp. M0898 TaxID=2957020 RepID=UPI00333A4C10